MNKTIRKLGALALMATVTLAGWSQKRGTFDATSIRPERVTTANAPVPGHGQPRVTDGVHPRSMGRTATPVDGSISLKSLLGGNTPGALSGMSKVSPKALGDGTIIYGSIIHANSWADSYAFGIYSFPASTYQAPTLVYDQGSYEANGGGCYYNGKYYWNSFVYTDEMGYTFSTYCTYDFATKEFTKQIQSFINAGFDLQQITNDITYDPSTGKIYALASIKKTEADGAITRYYPALSEMDIHTGIVSPIAQIPAMVALASTEAGELYAISKGDDAKLYRINKSTGDLTPIGSTGISTNYTQSMTFDPVTGKLYWAAVNAAGLTALYDVDVKTGHASKILDFADNEEFTGLYIPAPAVAEAAPAAVQEISASFPNGALSGKVTVKAPAKTFGGADLSGSLTLKLLVDGVEKESVTIAAGASGSFDLTLTEGIHSFTAYVSNAAGEGPRTAKAAYVGLDAPAPVQNLKLETTADGSARISWTAPATGRNDGYIDPAAITYTVTRYPDAKVVASNLMTTNYTDIVTEKADNYYYEVKGYNGTREGAPAVTESGIFGQGTSLPCKFSLASKDEFALFTVIDANKDWEPQYSWGGWMFGKDFKYTKEEDGDCAVYGYHPENAADDWLITPPVGVEAGKKYRLTFSMWTRGDKETIEVTAGNANTIAAQKPIIAKADYNHKDHRVFTQDFTATATGNYYIGFHITSAKKRYYAFVSDIMVDAVPEDDAPAAVTDLTATAGADGAENATVSFTAPSKNLAGGNLTAIERIDIYHGTAQEAVKSFAAPAPGAKLSWTEQNVKGWTDYRVVAYAGGKSGAKAEARVYVGWDIPTEIAEVNVSDASGKPVVTWTAPATGVNGGYIDSDKLTYSVYRYEDQLQLLSKDVKGTTFTDSSLDGTKQQHYVAYLVLPTSPAGNGEPSASEYIVYGEPYAAPFAENFEDAGVHSTPWVMYKLRGDVQSWGVTSYGSNPQCGPVDQDGGMAVFSTGGRVADEGILVSPKLSLASMKAPALSFYFYHNYTDEHSAWGDAFQDRLIPEVMLPDGTREALGDAILVDSLGTGWLKYSYPLDKYKNQPYVRLSFHGITDCEQDIYIDHISVSNVISNDLAAYTFTGNGKVEAGKGATYKLTVQNRGANDVADGAYKVRLMEGDRTLQTSNGPAVKSREYVTLAFTRTYDVKDADTSHELKAVIDWADDEYADNNTSSAVTTAVTKPSLSEIEKLSADQTENNVTLSWSKPSALRVNDSFEDHVAYETESFGDYLTVDGDGNNTYSFQDIYFNHAGEPMAFMVMNPVELGIVDKASTLFPYDAFDPRTGNQVLASFQGYGISDDGKQAVVAANDDWFISPEVFGGQTVKFYAKSADYMQGIDKFEFYYSSTGQKTSDFKPLTQKIESTGKDWTEYSYTLPADAKYFAIHCVSEDGFILFVDDLNFMARKNECAVALTGYRLYRNGTALTDLPASTLQYADNALGDGTYVYKLTALYAGGRESGASNEVTVVVGQGGIEAVTDDEGNVRYYNLQGIEVPRPDHGVYIKRANGRATKGIRR